jgi:hypothetical protein
VKTRSEFGKWKEKECEVENENSAGSYRVPSLIGKSVSKSVHVSCDCKWMEYN